jgi:hypothetical protein
MITDVIIRLNDGRVLWLGSEDIFLKEMIGEMKTAALPKTESQSETPAKRKFRFRRGNNKLRVWMPLSECLATAEFLTKSGKWISVAVWDISHTGNLFLSFITKEKKEHLYNGKKVKDFYAYHTTGKWYVDAKNNNLRNIKEIKKEIS